VNAQERCWRRPTLPDEAAEVTPYRSQQIAERYMEALDHFPARACTCRRVQAAGESQPPSRPKETDAGFSVQAGNRRRHTSRPAEPHSAVPNWRAGDTINQGSRTCSWSRTRTVRGAGASMGLGSRASLFPGSTGRQFFPRGGGSARLLLLIQKEAGAAARGPDN